jgi:hypothetical protein
MGPRLVDEMQPHIRRIAEPGGVAHDAFENRLLIVTALADNLQDLTRRCIALPAILEGAIISDRWI